MVDFKTITAFNVTFAAHPVTRDAHKHLNASYGGLLPTFDDIFTDAGKATLQDDCVDIIKHRILYDLILPAATSTTDKTIIPPLYNGAGFRVSWNSKPQARFSKASLTSAMTGAMANNHGQIDITISMNHLFFPQVLNYLDWSVFSLTVPPTTAAPAPAPGITVADMTTALTTAIQGIAGTRTATAPAPAPAPAPGSSTTTTSRYLFNPAGLPKDVHDAYKARQENQVITRSRVDKPFADGYRYHLDGTERLMLLDGSLFVIQADYNEKGLLRDPVICKDDTHQGIRAWYNTFQRHAMDHGFYVHPLYCFRKDHGGERGFTCGADKNDDLPQRLEIALSMMSQPLFRVLQKKDMFPAGSKCAEVVQQCFGNGYQALKQLVFRSHPVFQDQPSTLITTYPRQRNFTLLKYHSIFLDYLQLRAFISNQAASLDEAHELDIFIKNATHGTYLNRVTRDERKLTSLAHKYRGNQVIETLETFLQAPDSPTMLAPPTTPRPPSTQQRTSSAQRTSAIPRPPARSPRRVQAIAVDDNEDVPDLASVTSDESLESLEQELLQMEMSDEPEVRKIQALYTTSIFKIKTGAIDPSNQTCIVCDGQHRFDGCDVLKNTDFLRGHYIRYCQQLRRDAASRAATFPGSVGTIPGRQQQPVNFVDAHLVDNTHEDEDTDGEDPQDFQTGRR
jgi:hypothetical protein